MCKRGTVLLRIFHQNNIMMSDSSHAGDAPPSVDKVLTYTLTCVSDDRESLDAQGIISGEEELSGLYRYELRIASPGKQAADKLRGWFGKRVMLQVKVRPNGTGNGEEQPVQTVYGIVTSIVSGPVEQYENKRVGWFRMVVQPGFVGACYSRNRAVYRSGDDIKLTEDAAAPAPVTSSADNRAAVLTTIAERWGVSCKISEAAKTRIPDYLQLVQNDESDYNFFCRLLNCWGLGYYWEMPVTDKKEEQCEVMHIYDALNGEIIDSADAVACMDSRGTDFPSWSMHYGFHNLDAGQIVVQNYNGAFATASQNRVKLSLHDESWDQLVAVPDEKQTFDALHFLNRGFNANSVHGHYCYYCDESKNETDTNLATVAALHVGSRVTWRKEFKDYDKTEYFVTKREIQADFYQWDVAFSGRLTVSVGTLKVGAGVLPSSVELVAAPDLNEGVRPEKTAPEAAPKPRTFMAVVVSSVPLKYQGRNLCKVRELSGEEMWVEMGSPHADSNSGILARPRMGNVLFCMDRGDLSIPIALCAMFRGKMPMAMCSMSGDKSGDETLNHTPFTKLKVMDRQSRKMQEDTQDENAALTLRSRTHAPQRRIKTTTDTDNSPLDVHDRTITAEDLEFVQRPQNVKVLAEKPKPFNQIQMFSMDNGVRPVPQDDNISNVFAVDPVFETVAGFLSETDLTVGYPLCDAADAMQTANNVPITRPHLQGISMYSAGDMINQSADHQIMNAGGEIVLTAAQAITLRVGKSVIRISEYGIEMSSNAGLVHRTGAYPAYHTEDNAQNVDVLSGKTVPLAGGSIMVNNAGVYSRGPYIANTAVNMFTANTILGSAFTLSDFSGRLYAPAVEIIGGAALEKTATSIWKDAIFGVNETLKPWTPDPVYTGTLEDGYKKEGYNGSSVAKGCVNETINIIGEGISAVAGLGKNVANLFQPEGSMIKMLPERMVFSSLARFDYSSTTTNVSSAAAGFIATAENSSFFGGNASSKFATFKTLYTWGSELIGIFESIYDLAASSGSGDADTFSADNCDVKEDPKAPGGKDLNASDGWYIGEAAVGAIAGLLSLINPAEAMANLLFGRRKDDALGLIAEEKLTTTVTSANTNEVSVAKTQAATDVDEAKVTLSETLAEEIWTVASANVQEGDINEAAGSIADTIASYVATVQTSNNLSTQVTTTENVANRTITLEIKA